MFRQPAYLRQLRFLNRMTKRGKIALGFLKTGGHSRAASAEKLAIEARTDGSVAGKGRDLCP
jgi:hypothetical protein